MHDLENGYSSVLKNKFWFLLSLIYLIKSFSICLMFIRLFVVPVCLLCVMRRYGLASSMQLFWLCVRLGVVKTGFWKAIGSSKLFHKSNQLKEARNTCCPYITNHCLFQTLQASIYVYSCPNYTVDEKNGEEKYNLSHCDECRDPCPAALNLWVNASEILQKLLVSNIHGDPFIGLIVSFWLLNCVSKLSVSDYIWVWTWM